IMPQQGSLQVYRIVSFGSTINPSYHIDEMPAVLSCSSVRYYLDNALPYTTGIYQRTIAAVQRSGAQYLATYRPVHRPWYRANPRAFPSHEPRSEQRLGRPRRSIRRVSRFPDGRRGSARDPLLVVSRAPPPNAGGQGCASREPERHDTGARSRDPARSRGDFGRCNECLRTSVAGGPRPLDPRGGSDPSHRPRGHDSHPGAKGWKLSRRRRAVCRRDGNRTADPSPRYRWGAVASLGWMLQGLLGRQSVWEQLHQPELHLSPATGMRLRCIAVRRGGHDGLLRGRSNGGHDRRHCRGRRPYLRRATKRIAQG